MRDPMTWSFPLGRMFGVSVRCHIFLPIVFVALILRVVFFTKDPALRDAVSDAFPGAVVHELGLGAPGTG